MCRFHDFEIKEGESTGKCFTISHVFVFREESVTYLYITWSIPYNSEIIDHPDSISPWYCIISPWWCDVFWISYHVVFIPFHRLSSCQLSFTYITHCYWSYDLTQWGRDKMAINFLKTFSNGFSSVKMYEFSFRLELFLWFELTIFQHWFK